MKLFWILGFVGLDMLMTHFAVKRAEQRGYKKGWSAAEAYIIRLETEVDQARQEIWKEGL